MKRLILVIWLLNSFVAFAQRNKSIDKNDYVQIPLSSLFTKKTDSSKYLKFDGKNVVDIRKATTIQLNRIKERERIANLSDHRFWGLYINSYTGQFPRQSLALRFEQNTGAKIYEGIRWRWGTLYKNTIIINGKSDVEVIDGLITPENAKNYRYRIIQNDNKELMGWTTPTVFKKTIDGATYCFLSNIHYQKNQFVLIEIYNVDNYKDRDAIIIDWRETRPLAFWAMVNFHRKNFGNIILSSSLGSEKDLKRTNFIVTTTLSDIKFRLGDSLISLSFNSQNQPTSYNYQVNLKRTINGKVMRLNLGEVNGSYQLYKEYWNKPGQYEISFTPKLSSVGGHDINYLKEKTVTYKFTVLPELTPKPTFSTKELIVIGLVLCAIFGAILGASLTYIKRKELKKLVLAQQHREFSILQVNSIRSQLNPHFMFNALAGIQNLMNQHKIDEANSYLGKFARLTRNVLEQNELTSLTEEKELLVDYLQMEQLRFGFSYKIEVGPQIDLNVEIPSMLLQPFVENAVKHGIASNVDKGDIKILFGVNDKDLILSVHDNGRGFDVGQTYQGLGLQLSKNRIALLNTIYTTTPFILELNSDEYGTTVRITLTQWL